MLAVADKLYTAPLPALECANTEITLRGELS